MNRNTLLFLLCILTGTILFSSCKKDTSEKLSEIDYEINRFIWSGLNYYYLWLDNVPELQEKSYSGQFALDYFLNSKADHEDFFHSLLYKPGKVDNWSWIVDDYVSLENQFKGIYKTNGMDFRLGLYTDNSHVFGFVRYVMKDSPADKAGIKRGDFFTSINNTKLTIDNYQSLLFDNQTYTVNVDTLVNKTLISTGRNVPLTAIEFQDNPIYLDTVYTINDKKIGYLVYNTFIANYSLALNDVFQKFKIKGINELILDLRYNPGGDENNMIDLASMIYTTDKSKVFMQTVYNNNVQNQLAQRFGTDYFKRYFSDKVEYTSANNQTSNYPINSLNLSKLHVITSDNTASAGEVLMCGLKPYMQVVILGDTTEGKYVGSVTVKDYIDNDGNVNPNHSWAMQPIIVKVANKDGITDYIGGYIPNILLQEDITNLGKLGDINEPLLKRMLNYINGISPTASSLKSKAIKYSTVADSKDAYRFRGGLNMDKRYTPYKLFQQN
ncbi:MAG TPA: S41 family peptidase [Bacteroidales bacterium]|nr:S41 family peptidase [Bacteroidales bacterium]